MKTINDAKRIITEQGIDAYRAHIKTIRSDLDTLRGLYADSISANETPAQTVAAYVAAVGFDRAAVILASLVNRYAWDGRISETAKEWAETVSDAYDENAGVELYISADTIHCCHLDQLARAMAEYVPAETTNTTTDAQSADDMKGANTMNTTTNNTETTTNAARMFPRLSAEIEADAANRVYSVEHFIKYGFRPSWGEQHQTDPDRGLRQWLTPRRWEQYQGGEIDRARAVELATHRATTAENKVTARNLAKLGAAAAAPGFDAVAVSVTWARSRTWGANPTAEVVNIGDRKTTGHASGCGYDKESAAIAEALNQNPAALRVLYDLAENALSAGKSPMTCTGYDWRDSIGYGSGYGVLPYFEGGVGSDCFWSLFKSAGYTVKSAGSGKMFDCWTLSK